MTEHEAHTREPAAASPLCPTCGRPYVAGDRFCAECGTRLETEDPSSVLRPPSHDLWLFGAKPGTVVLGGVLLLALAAVLLFAGQRDDTGTIVMLSICVTPLALLTVAIGAARAVSRRSGVRGFPTDQS